MEEIKIGDIIEPITPARRKKLGRGIVVAVKQSQRLPVTAVFPTKNGLFVNYDFTEIHVSAVEVTEKQRKRIMKAEDSYRQLMGELNRV